MVLFYYLISIDWLCPWAWTVIWQASEVSEMLLNIENGKFDTYVHIERVT